MSDTLYTHLDNGLTVILRPMRHAPVASLWVWYRVGSRDEWPGVTGASHFVEHMLFKGTPTFPGEMLKRVIDREGGFWNAITGQDATRYYETLPADRFDLALRLEADRMQHALFNPDDVASERTVIISEREGHENAPGWRLSEEVQALAFRVHSYHHRVIGDRADLDALTRDQLYAHYQAYYVPNNAVLVAVGDFDTTRLLDRVAALYGLIPAGPPPPRLRRDEPPQQGERRVHLTGPDPTSLVQMAFHTPPARHPDFFPLVMLDAVLGGAAGQHRSSRLYKALVETELATSVGCSYSATLDPYLFNFSATVREGRAAGDVEAALLREIDRVTGETISDAELTKAVKQFRARLVYGAETVTGMGYQLGDAEMLGDYRLFDRLLDQLYTVTPEDLARVAQTYLAARNRVVGWYTPDGNRI